MPPDVPPGNTETSRAVQRQPTASRRTGAVIAAFAALVMSVIAAEKIYESYAPAGPDASAAAGESDEPVPLDFNDLAEGAVLLDTADPCFASCDLRLSRIQRKTKEPRSHTFRLFPGTHKKGLLLRVGKNVYSISNANPMTGTRLSGHVTRVSKDESMFKVESASWMFQGMWVHVTQDALFDAMDALQDSPDKRALAILCHVTTPNGTLLQEATLDFEREADDAPMALPPVLTASR